MTTVDVPARPGSRPEQDVAPPLWRVALTSFAPPGRRARVDRWLRALPLGLVLAVQAVCAARLDNSAFQDEALYIHTGRLLINSWTGGEGPYGRPETYFSGAPQLYPVWAGLLNEVGGLHLVRAFSMLCMLSATVAVAWTANTLIKGRSPENCAHRCRALRRDGLRAERLRALPHRAHRTRAGPSATPPSGVRRTRSRPLFLAAMIKAESGFDTKAARPASGEYGIAMWTPSVFRAWAVDGDRDGDKDYMSPPTPSRAWASSPAGGRALQAERLREKLPGLIAAAAAAARRPVIETGGVPARCSPCGHGARQLEAVVTMNRVAVRA